MGASQAVESNGEPHEQVDFFEILPFEVSLLVLSYLPVEDVFRCLRVSRRWRLFVSECSPLWRIIRRRLGVSQHLVYESAASHCSLMDLVSAVMKHRHWLSSRRVERGVLSGSTNEYSVQKNPHLLFKDSAVKNATYFAGGRFLVFSTPSNPLVVMEVATGARAVADVPNMGTSYDPIILQPSIASERVAWATCTSNCLLAVTVTGKWIRYSRLDERSRIDFIWKSPVVSLRAARYTNHQVFAACCKKCFLVAMAAASHSKSPNWDLQILCLGQEQDDSQRVLFMRTVLIKKQAEEDVLNVLMAPAVVPDSACSQATTGEDNAELCLTHHLIFQCSESIVCFRLHSSGTLESSGQHVIPHCRSKHTHLPSSPPAQQPMCAEAACLSVDQTLMGLVVGSRYLCVWRMRNQEVSLEADVDIATTLAGVTAKKGLAIVSLGELYSAVACREVFGSLYIISTLTGEVIAQANGDSARSGGRTTKAWEGLPHLVSHQCLSDFSCWDLPFFVYGDVNAKKFSYLSLC